MQPQHPEATCDYEPSADEADRGAARPVAFAHASATPNAELQSLLRKRLRFAAFLFAGIHGLIGVSILALWFGGDLILSAGTAVQLGGLAFVVFVAASLAWRLGRSEGVSIGRLRTYEGLLFGSVLGLKFYAAFDWARPFTVLSHGLDLYQNGRADLAGQYFAAAGGGNFLYWVLFIVAYGVLIPNTWQRCTVTIGAVSLLLMLSWSGLGLWMNAPFKVWFFSFLFYPLVIVTATAVLAIYASHRIEQSRQQVWETRKLGQYQLKHLLGKGGMGEVYLSEHLLLRRPCAVKLIRPDKAEDAAILARFEREVQMTAALTHPNTIQIFDYGHTEDGTFYYVMEYLPGLTLEELVKREGPLSPERTVHFLRQLCGALAEAHRVGLIHRDIKPGNVMVCERGGIADVAKLLDFGLVRAQPGRENDAHLTQDGAIPGTPAFMSPEQAAGKGDLDARSDIYALGALAYFLLTGQPPFAGRPAMQVLAAHMYEPPALLTTHRPDLSVELQEIVLRCLAKSPTDRFPDAAELEKVLAEFLSKTPTTRYPDTPRNGERTVNESRPASAEQPYSLSDLKKNNADGPERR